MHTLDFPAALSFDVPSDYARCCNEHPLRIKKCDDFKDGFEVSWDDDVLSFGQGSVIVEYDRRAVIGIVSNMAEKAMHGETISTLRAVFRESDGSLGSLPIFMVNPALSRDGVSAFAAVVRAFFQLPLPVKTFNSPEEFRNSIEGT
jgi:hypothetical protein